MTRAREQVADLSARSGCRSTYSVKRRPLAAAVAGDELLGHPVERVAVRTSHVDMVIESVRGARLGVIGTPGRKSGGSKKPGIVTRTALSRFRARI